VKARQQHKPYRRPHEGLEVLPGRRGWVVEEEYGGRRLAGPFATRAEAEAARRALVQEVRAARGERRRTCLCCGVAFDSRGRFNRLCSPCAFAVGRLPAQMGG
jgi:hypothetical protein